MRNNPNSSIMHTPPYANEMCDNLFVQNVRAPKHEWTDPQQECKKCFVDNIHEKETFFAKKKRNIFASYVRFSICKS